MLKPCCIASVLLCLSACGAPEAPIETAPVTVQRHGASPTVSAVDNRPENPSRQDVRDALAEIAADVEHCGNGSAGVIQASYDFAASGEVRELRLSGAPDHVRACARPIALGARLPPFRRPSFRVNFPFRYR